ncbi:hypothetical protein ACQPZP_03095 [Spirillospora sp. CA-142024]|uniref:hypothetical protein n=1 Tax=Spirillospora sp. CA-142024 TaxID=3240036 RepID=UPI003D9333F1
MNETGVPPDDVLAVLLKIKRYVDETVEALQQHTGSTRAAGPLKAGHNAGER